MQGAENAEKQGVWRISEKATCKEKFTPQVREIAQSLEAQAVGVKCAECIKMFTV